MGAVPQHPFFQRVIESLQAYDRSWVLPYITVMYSTGPLFLSVIWKEYMSDSPATESARVRILMLDEYNRHSWSFFSHHRGSSWHGEDARLIFWMGSHWMLLTALGFLAAGVVGFVLWWGYRRILLFGARKIQPRGSSKGGLRVSMPSLWRRSSGKPQYELVESRHEV